MTLVHQIVDFLKLNERGFTIKLLMFKPHTIINFVVKMMILCLKTRQTDMIRLILTYVLLHTFKTNIKFYKWHMKPQTKMRGVPVLISYIRSINFNVF